VHCGRLRLSQARAPCCERMPRAAAGCFVRCAAGCKGSRCHCAEGDKRLCAPLREGQPLWGARASRRVTGAGCARSMPSAFTATLLDLLARFPQLRVILVSQVRRRSHPRPRSGAFADPPVCRPPCSRSSLVYLPASASRSRLTARGPRLCAGGSPGGPARGRAAQGVPSQTRCLASCCCNPALCGRSLRRRAGRGSCRR
jgi:hypothetical protein